MLRSAKEMVGYTIDATDGDLGRVHDFLFDDDTWAVRYMVVDTRKWLPGRKVLLTPESVDRADWEARAVSVNLTKEKVKNSPHIDTEKPVSRQYEKELHSYYAWTPYWNPYGGGLPAPMPATVADEEEEQDQEDRHLRQLEELRGYAINATDGDIGQLSDVIVDDEEWVVRYLIVDTGTWLPGKRVMLSPEWAEMVDWGSKELQMGLTREQIEKAPPFDPTIPINRDYEMKICDYYGRPKYWM